MPLRIVAADKPKRQAVTRFRSTGPEGKSHSTKEGRSAEAQRAYMRKHGPQKPRRKTLAVTDKYKEVRKKLNPFATAERRKAGPTARGQKKKLPIITVVEDSEGLKDAKKIKGKPHSSPQGRVLSHIRTSSPFVVKKATGGRIGLKSGTKQLRRKGWKSPQEQLGGSEKAKPHSTKEGRVASGKRRFERLHRKAVNDWHDITWTGPDREKGKPHSSQEGQIATGRRNFRKVLERYKGRAKPLRAKKAQVALQKSSVEKQWNGLKKIEKLLKKKSILQKVKRKLKI